MIISSRCREVLIERMYRQYAPNTGHDKLPTLSVFYCGLLYALRSKENYYQIRDSLYPERCYMAGRIAHAENTGHISIKMVDDRFYF